MTSAPKSSETAGEAVVSAHTVYDEFVATAQDKALVCLGSMKSNPVGELTVAAAFGCEPFQSQDDRESASQRDCPFYIRFRDRDPHPDSCWGGLKLSAGDESSQSGIYYEQVDGTWSCCPCDGAMHDAAFLLYVHCESQGWLEMTMGGFSGRATRLLARTLPPAPKISGRPFTVATDATMARSSSRTRCPPMAITSSTSSGRMSLLLHKLFGLTSK